MATNNALLKVDHRKSKSCNKDDSGCKKKLQEEKRKKKKEEKRKKKKEEERKKTIKKEEERKKKKEEEREKEKEEEEKRKIRFDCKGYLGYKMERGLLELALLALVVVNACSFLAMEGVVLDQYYVQDVCSPSRATFMTGRYPIHNSIVDWIPPASSYGLPLNETTMAQKFKEAGYMSHATGKWHLGFYKWEHTPTFRGFDSFKGFYSGGEDYFSHVANGAYDFRTDSRPDCGKGCSALNTGDQGRYSTTVFSEEAVRIPQVPEEYTKPYRTSIQDPKRRTFAGMLSAVDEGIGNVTKALKSRGMYENTLVIFSKYI
eukprot:g4354.t1